jgi:hypothetical protein
VDYLQNYLTQWVQILSSWRSIYLTVAAIEDVRVALVTRRALTNMPSSFKIRTGLLAKAVATEAGRRPIAVTCKAGDEPVQLGRDNGWKGITFIHDHRRRKSVIDMHYVGASRCAGVGGESIRNRVKLESVGRGTTEWV